MRLPGLRPATISVAAVFVLVVGSAGQAFACVDRDRDNSLHLETSVAVPTLSPSVTLTLHVDRPTATPGAALTYSALVTNAGTTLTLTGTIEVANSNWSPVTLAAWHDYISVDQKGRCGVEEDEEAGRPRTRWTPIAGAAGARSGYKPAIKAPISTGEVFSAVPIPSDGVNYSVGADTITGTYIGRKATARWSFTAVIALSASQAASLFRGSVALPIRESFYAEPSTGIARGEAAAETVSADFCRQLTALRYTGNATDVRVALSLPDGTVRTLTRADVPALGSIPPGASATVTTTYTVPVPSPKGATETDAAYATRLATLDGATLTASAIARLGPSGPTAGPAGPVNVTETLPILTLAKTGPATVDAGGTAAYGLALANTGSAPAASLTVADSLPDGTTITVTGAPASLAPGASGTAYATYQVPPTQPAGNLTDTATLRWTDAAGNTYGPISAQATSLVKQPHVLASLTLGPPQSGPLPTGASLTFTVKALDQNGAAMAGMAVHLSIVGANAGSADVVTGLDGTATYAYSGSHSGTDTAQATGAGPYGTLASNTATVLWAVPVVPVTTSTVHARFYPSAEVNTDDFTATPGMTPLWEQDFPNISFDPLGGKVKNDQSGVGAGTRPFTDVTTDLAGNYTGTIVAQGNGYQAGVGTLVAFDTEFTATFVIAEAGDYQFDFVADDGFIFGIDGGATSLPGSVMYRCPASGLTVFENYPVMGCYQHNTPAIPNEVLVHFPAPGTYHYELDYLEVYSGSLSLNMTMHSTGLQVAPMGSITLSPLKPANAQRGVAQTYTAAVLGVDGSPIAGLPVTLHISGANLAELTAVTDANGLATFSYSGATAGTDDLEAFAYVGEYLVLSNTVEQTWTSDPPAPVMTVESPADGSIITEPTPIKASLTPPPGTSIDSWSVSYQLNDGGTSIPLNSGTDTPPETLATLDPTVLVNGNYTISINVVTTGGTSQTSSFSVVVDGNLKLGRYQVTYQDASIAAAGLPIQLLRTYDSFDKTNGDFGVGWRVGLNSLRIYSNGPLGAGGWSQYPKSCFAAGLGGGLCVMGWTSSRPHFVTVVWPDGHQEVFDFTPTDSSNLFWQSSAAFTGRPGTTSKLEIIGDATVSYRGDGTLYSGIAGSNEFNPTGYPIGYRLTTKDGTVYDFANGPGIGLSKVTDRAGNTLMVFSTGIRSSFGPQISIARDGSGRITGLANSDGTHVWYGYDASGDLVSVKDERGKIVTFEYDANHNLTKTIDPDGRPFETVQYDDSGRILSVTDAAGNTTDVSSDPDTRQERVTDPGGKTTISSFNADGDLVRVDVIADGKTATTRYEYDANHNVISRTDPSGGVWSATYDGRRNLTSVTDALGHTVRLTYDDYGYPLTWTDPNGGVTAYHWNANGTLASVTDALGNDETYEYDSKGSMTARTDRDGHRWVYTYEGAGRLATATDPLGNKTTYTYDDGGRVKTLTDPLGHTTSYTYDTVGNLTKVTDPANHSTTYTYDSLNSLATVTDPAGKTTTYGRDPAGRVTSVTDPTGAVTRTTYNAIGKVATTTDAEGNQTLYTYDGFGNLASTTDPSGRTTTNTYDLRGLLATSTNPAGGVTHYEHDADGNQTRVTDPDGRVTRSTYGPHGEVLSSTDPAGAVTRYTYDLLGRETKITDPTGRTTITDYSATGLVADTKDPAGATTRYGYDDAGRQTSVTDPLGHTTSYGYDAAGRQTSVTDALGHSSTYAYDDAGRLVSVTSAAGYVTTYEYDPRGLVTKITDALGHSTTSTYDDAGRLATQTDPDGAKTSYTYDPRGLEASMTDALGHSVGFTYDAAGQQTALTDANGSVWHTSYDALGSVATTTDPLGHTATYTHDTAGLLTRSVDARGITTTYGYDTAGRLASIATPDGAISTTYDAAGRRATMTDPTGLTTYGYDTAGRLASIAGPGANASYTYDPAGNRATMSAGGKTTTYTYDAAERLASVSRPDLGTFTFAYNADGALTTLTRPNGVTSTNTYDAAGRLTGLTYKNSGGTTIAAYTYTLDAAGNRTSATSAAGTEHYAIDPAGRLTGVTYADGTAVSFTYDAAGNRTSMTAGGSTTPYTYDAAGQLKTAGSTSYTYDPAGNRLTAGSSSYTYDDFGHLASQTWGATTIAYQTNGSGLRVSATSGSTTSAYNWDAAAALPSLLSDGTADYLSADTTLLAETSASANAYPLTDALGSVRAQTDGTGALTASASYGAYGDVRSTSGSIGSLGYTGALSDSSGLVYLQARSLDPSTGTFTSRDSLTPGGSGITGYNPYAYAGQNPVTYTDPSGRMAEMTLQLGTETPPAVIAGLTLSQWMDLAIITAALILGTAVVCAELRCGIPLPAIPPWGLPTIPIARAISDALSLTKNWAQGFVGEIKTALGVGGLSPFLFLRYHVYFWVPDMGARFLDICGYDNPVVAATDPQHPRFCAEIKTGNSKYTEKQQAKDAWISAHYGFPIWEWRLPA